MRASSKLAFRMLTIVQVLWGCTYWCSLHTSPFVIYQSDFFPFSDRRSPGHPRTHSLRELESNALGETHSRRWFRPGGQRELRRPFKRVNSKKRDLIICSNIQLYQCFTGISVVPPSPFGSSGARAASFTTAFSSWPRSSLRAPGMRFARSMGAWRRHGRVFLYLSLS